MQWFVCALFGVVLLAIACLLAFAVFGSACNYRLEYLARGQLASLERKIAQFQFDTGRLPSTLHELTLPGDAGLGPYSKPSELRDPWGAPLYYRVFDSAGAYTLFTLGSDGRLGGDDGASDVEVPEHGQ